MDMEENDEDRLDLKEIEYGNAKDDGRANTNYQNVKNK